MKITLNIPDHRPTFTGLDELNENKARAITAWRILDALIFATENNMDIPEAVISALDEEDHEPQPGAYARLLREKEELQDTLDEIKRCVS